MEMKQIKELMTSMGRLGIKKLSIKNKEVELELERECSGGTHHLMQGDSFLVEGQGTYMMPKVNHELPKSHEHTSLAHTTPVKSDVLGSFITSPMVGTFYISPSPDASPFVQIGQKVEKDTVVCIIEAMKVMNEIKAGHAGVLVERLVDAETPVEFGTKLFKIV